MKKMDYIPPQSAEWSLLLEAKLLAGSPTGENFSIPDEYEGFSILG